MTLDFFLLDQIVPRKNTTTIRTTKIGNHLIQYTYRTLRRKKLRLKKFQFEDYFSNK